MEFVETSIDQHVAKVVPSRGKANAINEALADELRCCFEELAADADVKAVVLSGKGNFFSFGLDVPEFLQYAKDDFIRFVTKFADLYTYIFVLPEAGDCCSERPHGSWRVHACHCMRLPAHGVG